MIGKTNRYTGMFFCLLWVLLQPLDAAAVPKPPNLKSSAYLLQDFNSGEILASANPDERVEPASITKMMTAYLVFGEIKSNHVGVDDQVLVSKKAWKQRGSKMFIEVNKRVKVGDLLKGLIIQSGNDAAVALAEHVAGSEEVFVNMMNAKAKALGMSNTHYVNSTGWPVKNHYTTASDMAILSKHIIREFPEFYKLHSRKEFTYNKIKQYNRNRLLWRDEAVDGIKTGHTDSAGYCLVSSAQREDMRLIAVVFGAKSKSARIDESQSLLNYGFRFFETHKLYKANQSLQSVRVWKGQKNAIDLGLVNDLYVTIARGKHESLNTEVVFNQPIIAPVEKGTEYGQLKVTLEGNEIVSKSIFALEDVKRGGLWRRTVDEVKLWFN